MRYMLLIYTDEASYAGMTEQEQGEDMGRWMSYTADFQSSGKMQGGEALEPASTATTVRLGANGSTIRSDGPFAETREALGGFYIINADNLDEAVAWASKMPNLTRGGSVEIRPIVEFG